MDMQEDILNFQSGFNGRVPVHDGRRRHRRPERRLRRGDADEDHVRQRGHRPPGHAPPREHAPVVGRQRLRGRLQPDVLQGGLATLGEYLYAARTRRTRQAAGHGGWRRRLRAEPRRPVQHELRHDEHDVLDRRAVEPDRRQPVLDGEHVHAARHRVHRAAADPRRGDRFNAGAAADPARPTAAASITEPQLEDVVPPWLPNQSAACHAQLDQFFTQWFDTPIRRAAARTGRRSPGPGLDGAGFYDDAGPCTRAEQTIDFAPLAGQGAGERRTSP